MTEKEFHVLRRMFAVKGGTVLIAPSKDERSHYEWLLSILGTIEGTISFNDCVRGYYLNRRLIGYTGPNFSHRINHDDFMAALNIFEEMYDISEVAFGAIAGQDAGPWRPRTVMMTKVYKEAYRRL